jgi:hypothetical protein
MAVILTLGPFVLVPDTVTPETAAAQLGLESFQVLRTPRVQNGYMLTDLAVALEDYNLFKETYGHRLRPAKVHTGSFRFAKTDWNNCDLTIVVQGKKVLQGTLIKKLQVKTLRCTGCHFELDRQVQVMDDCGTNGCSWCPHTMCKNSLYRELISREKKLTMTLTPVKTGITAQLTKESLIKVCKNADLLVIDMQKVQTESSTTI